MTGTPGFLDLPPENCAIESAKIVVLPVPYDATSSWKKGADNGPDALLRASAHVEWLDLERSIEPRLLGIATLDPIRHEGSPESLSESVAASISAIYERGQFPVLLGGEHSISIGAIRETARRFDDLTVLQIDAHADTRESYLGSPCNHACVMARAREVADIMQVGIRSAETSEVAALDPDRIIYAHQIPAAGDDSWIEKALSGCSSNVYITFDLDAFDPSLLPATGTPEPDGLSWRQANALIRRVAEERNVVGFDVVELCPQPGQHASEFVAAKLVHRMLSEIFAAHPAARVDIRRR